MSNLIEIEARHLKWCPYGFRFWQENDCKIYSDKSEYLWKSDLDITAFEESEAVLVDPEEYTKAVIKSAEQYLGKIHYTEKNRKGKGVFCRFGTSPYGVKVEFDIMPWKDSYEYKLEVE